MDLLINLLETFAPISIFLFGLIPAFTETKQEVPVREKVNGQLVQRTKKRPNKWGWIAILGAFLSMVITISIKYTKMEKEFELATIAEEKARMEADSARRVYNKNVAFQELMNKSTDSLIQFSEEINSDLQISLLKQDELHVLQNRNMGKQENIITDMKRAILPLAPLKVSVTFSDRSDFGKWLNGEIKKAHPDMAGSNIIATESDPALKDFIRKSRSKTLFANQFQICIGKELQLSGSDINIPCYFKGVDTSNVTLFSEKNAVYFLSKADQEALEIHYYLVPEISQNTSSNIIGIPDLAGLYITIHSSIQKPDYVSLYTGPNKLMVNFSQFDFDSKTSCYYHKITKKDLHGFDR